MQRLRVSRSLTAAYVFIACVGLMVYAYHNDFMTLTNVWGVSSIIVFNVVFWYGMLRSGVNLRFKEPALTLPQVLSALIIIVYGYMSTGRIHGSLMMLLTHHEPARLPHHGHRLRGVDGPGHGL